MKIRLQIGHVGLSLAFVALCAACSAPKMAYKFDYHDYNAGRKTKEVKEEVASNPGPMPVQAESLLAMESTKEENTSIESIDKSPVIASSKTYEEMTKKERRTLRNEFKRQLHDIKKIVKKKDKDNVNSVEATKIMDKDLKLATIFGAVGIVGMIIGSASAPIFWVGAIALLIGVVFFVKWLIRQ
jgi:hypothetical protein